MRTIEDKLSELINTKSGIRNKIIEMGVNIPGSEPFKKYPDYIALIKEIEETTDDQDLLQMCDVLTYIGSGNYENKVYTDEEIQNVKDYLDFIIEGGNSDE